MKQSKLTPLLTLVMSFQLIISPVLAQSPSLLNQGLGIIGAFMGNTQMPAGDPNQAQNQAMIGQMQEQSEDLWFNPQKMSQIPGLQAYLGDNFRLLNCPTLRTTLNEVIFPGCSTQPPQGNYDYNGMMSIAGGYRDAYDQIAKQYNNYSQSSLGGGSQGTQAFGVGCMNNAKALLDGFFNYRLDELDKLVTNLEAMNAAFKNASRADLNAIEEDTALLDGGDADYVNEAKTRNPELFNFGARFNNPACKSMYSADSFNAFGTDKGLNKINSTIKTQRSTTPRGGKYSGESFAAGYPSVVADINAMASRVSTQAEQGFDIATSNPGGFYNSLKNNVSSVNGLQSILDANFFSAANDSFSRTNDRLKTELANTQSELAAGNVDPSRAIRMLTQTNAGGFENELATLENKIKNNCLANAINSSGGMAGILGRIYDPQKSAFANKNASSFLKAKLEQIMSNPNTSAAKKLEELKAAEAQNGSNYLLRMENSYEFTDLDASGNPVRVEVPASKPRTPSVYFGNLVTDCNAQFRINKLNNQMSGAQAIAKLRSLNTEYKALQRSFSADLARNVKQKLIECSSPAEANNEVPGSCTPDRFEMKANFCANGALTCANNMTACGNQAQAFVTETKNKRTARVNNYKNIMAKHKTDMVGIFDVVLRKYGQEAEALRGVFSAGFTSPAGIEREVPQANRYLADLKSGTTGSPDGTLLLEDPDKLMEMFKKNTIALRRAVKDQQDKIIGSSSPIAAHIAHTKTVYAAVEAKATAMVAKCEAGMAAMGAMMAEKAKQESELGERRARFCSSYRMLRTHPGPACSGELDDVTSGSLGAATREGAAEAADAQARLADACNRYNSHSSSDSSTSNTWSSICYKPAYIGGVLPEGTTDQSVPPVPSGSLGAQIKMMCAYVNGISCTGDVAATATTGATKSRCTQTQEKFKEQIVGAFSVAEAGSLVPDMGDTGGEPSICISGDNSNRGADPFSLNPNLDTPTSPWAGRQ